MKTLSLFRSLDHIPCWDTLSLFPAWLSAPKSHSRHYDNRTHRSHELRKLDATFVGRVKGAKQQFVGKLASIAIGDGATVSGDTLSNGDLLLVLQHHFSQSDDSFQMQYVILNLWINVKQEQLDDHSRSYNGSVRYLRGRCFPRHMRGSICPPALMAPGAPSLQPDLRRRYSLWPHNRQSIVLPIFSVVPVLLPTQRRKL